MSLSKKFKEHSRIRNFLHDHYPCVNEVKFNGDEIQVVFGPGAFKRYGEKISLNYGETKRKVETVGRGIV
jgi:phosphotransferase system IIB component